MHQKIGYRSARWEVIPNGIDTNLFRPDGTARRRWRQVLGIADETFVIGMLARRDPMKDHEGFLIAAKEMAEVRSDIAFVLAGAGVDWQDQRLSKFASDVSAPVHMLGFCPEPHSLMAAWDLAVLASRFGEGFPNAVAEAMACGLPCVVTDVGDAARIVGSTGWIVPVGDPTSLARTGIGVLASRTTVQKNGIAARLRIEAKYSLPYVVNRYESLYQQLLDL